MDSENTKTISSVSCDTTDTLIIKIATQYAITRPSLAGTSKQCRYIDSKKLISTLLEIDSQQDKTHSSKFFGESYWRLISLRARFNILQRFFMNFRSGDRAGHFIEKKGLIDTNLKWLLPRAQARCCSEISTRQTNCLQPKAANDLVAPWPIPTSWGDL